MLSIILSIEKRLIIITSQDWFGTLRMKSMSMDGKINKVVYEDTINCSGPCPIPFKEKQNKEHVEPRREKQPKR